MEAVVMVLTSVGMLLAVVTPLALIVFLSMLFRRVVKPNEVHVVNRRTISMAYGRPPEPDPETGKAPYQTYGNAYYAWPSWVPRIGVTTVRIPLSNFNLELDDYEAYDDGKVPFKVDVMAFFRVSNPIVASQRIDLDSEMSPMRQLKEQLLGVLKGTTRSILAKHEIKEIMTERATFGQKFTQETESQLPEWGVTNIRNIELMDVRDAEGYKTISNIMAVKESAIARDSRVQVANNTRDAQQAEINAQKEVDLRDQEAQQQVGERTAMQTQMVGVAQEKAKQEIKEQARITMEKDMAVIKVNQVSQADIDKGVAVVQANQHKETFIIKSEGDKQSDILIAEGKLVAAQKEGEGIRAVGEGVAEAARLKNLAGITPEITLAKEIGENPSYQAYLIGIRNVEANERIGVAQADALKAADIKVIVNGESASNGMNSVLDLISGKGGLKTAQFLEQLANTSEQGAALIGRAAGKKQNGVSIDATGKDLHS